MATIPSIQDTKIRVGDVLSVVAKQPGLIFSEVTVTEIDREHIKVRHAAGEWDVFTRDGYWNFFLVDRPKPKLPTKLGSVVKEGDNLWVLCDPHDTLKWRSTRDDWETDVFFDHVDWELVD